MNIARLVLRRRKGVARLPAIEKSCELVEVTVIDIALDTLD
jgi:hypothetical protein